MKYTGLFLKPIPSRTVRGQKSWRKQQEFQLVQGMDQENLATIHSQFIEWSDCQDSCTDKIL